MTDEQPIKMKSTMFADGGGGMRIQQRECVDYPGIFVTSTLPSRNEKWINVISYGGKEYPTMAAAIDAWKYDHSH